jgi:FkbM family methyltransferase
MRPVFSKLAKQLKKLANNHLFNRTGYQARKRWREDRGDQTLRLDYPLDPISVVFDLGGYHGDFAQAMHERYGCTVYLFEPVPRFYRHCVERFQGNPVIRCFNFGLAAQDGTLSISNDENASSLYTKLAAAPDHEEVEVRSFIAFAREHGIDRIDLLKINIEGGEFEVLSQILENDFISHIRYLQIQFHDFIPNARPMREALRHGLSASHSESWCYPFVWESWEIKP